MFAVVGSDNLGCRPCCGGERKKNVGMGSELVFAICVGGS